VESQAGRLPETVPPRRRIKPRSPVHQALGEAIGQLRSEAGLTLEELADKADMRIQLISELERGTTNPILTTLVRVSKGLDIELSELSMRLEEIRDSRRG
jgi:transcriptional regulator with XRE-family HTH domain